MTSKSICRGGGLGQFVKFTFENNWKEGEYIMRFSKNIVILTILLCLGCVGCEKKQEKSNTNSMDIFEENLNRRNEFPTEYKVQEDRITFNTEVVVADQVRKNGMDVISASLQEINAEKAYEFLMKNVEIRDKGEENSQLWYEGVNNEILTVTPYSLGYSTRFFTYINHAFRLQQGYSDYNAYKYSTEKDLSFETRQNAFNAIKEVLRNIGIEVGEEYRCFALDYKTMQQEEYVIDINGDIDKEAYKDSWTQDDDSYYFIINQSYKETPAYHIFYDAFPLVADENAPIQVIYNKNGIQFLQIEKVFTFRQEEGVYNLKSFSEVAEVLQKKYGMLLGDSFYEVNFAQLYYMENKLSENRYEILPVWIFRTKESSTGKVLQDVVNAQTAEEIVWKEK